MTEAGEAVLREIEREGTWGHYVIDKIVLIILAVINLLTYNTSDSPAFIFVIMASFAIYGVVLFYEANFYGTSYKITNQRVIARSTKFVVSSTEPKAAKESWVYHGDIADVFVTRTWLDRLFGTGTVVLVFEKRPIDFLGRINPSLPKLKKNLAIIHVDDSESVAEEIKILSEKERKNNSFDEDRSLPWTEIPSLKEIMVLILVLFIGGLFLIAVSNIDLY